MLLKRGIGTSSAKTYLKGLRKWAMGCWLMVKYQPFYYKLVDHEIKKITSLF